MPIKSLESYLFERKLVSTSSIEILQNATIGIDVEHYLSRIYTFKKEQFLSGIGGIPSSLKDYIQSDLQVFREYGITPIFVISGLGIQLQQNTYRTNELSPQEQHLENTWSKLNSKSLNPYGYNNLNSESFRLFTDPLPVRPMINDLIKYFIDININYMVAPYDASFQLSYLYQNKMIDLIYGSTDLLLTKVDKFILGMEFQSKDFRFIDKAKILNELNLSERQFLDLSIIVGCNVQPITFPNFPPLPKPNPMQPYPQLSYFKLGLEIIYNSYNNGVNSDLYAFIISLNDQRLLDLYYKGHSAMNFLPVLNKEGYVELYSVEMSKLGLLDENDIFWGEEFDGGVQSTENLSSEDSKNAKKPTEKTQDTSDDGDANKNIVRIPNDVHDIISQRLPPELYFYLSIGLIRVEIMEAITEGQLKVRPPFESGLSDSYKKLITSPFYEKLLDSQFNLITQLLTRYYQVKKINITYWFKDDKLELNNRLNPPIFKQVSHLVVNQGSEEPFTLKKFFGQLSEEFKPDPISTKDVTKCLDIISTSLLRTLYLYEIIDNKTNKLTADGIILKRLVREHGKDITEEELNELITILLLIKSNTIKLNEPNKEFGSVPKSFKEYGNDDYRLSEDEQKHLTLISRIFSVHKFNISPINYQGPISRALINFRSHLKYVSNNLINTIECLLVDLIVHQENDTIKSTYEDRLGWSNLVNQIPFYKDCNNTLLGILAEIYFEYSLKQKKANKETTKEKIIKNTRDHILNYVFQINNSSFNINVNGINSITSEQLLRDFNNGLVFWGHFVNLMKIANSLDTTLVSQDYLTAVEDTDEWLHQFV